MLPWWATFLITLAVKFGVPELIKLFPSVPGPILAIIEELLKKLEDPAQSNSAAKKDAIAKISACTGTGCPPDTK